MAGGSREVNLPASLRKKIVHHFPDDSLPSNLDFMEPLHEASLSIQRTLEENLKRFLASSDYHSKSKCSLPNSSAPMPSPISSPQSLSPPTSSPISLSPLSQSPTLQNASFSPRINSNQRFTSPLKTLLTSPLRRERKPPDNPSEVRNRRGHLRNKSNDLQRNKSNDLQRNQSNDLQRNQSNDLQRIRSPIRDILGERDQTDVVIPKPILDGMVFISSCGVDGCYFR
jgi:hypothetical protein